MTPFDAIELQPKAWMILSRSYEADRVASTYLFHGPEGTGHWALAISLAALLNCESPDRSGQGPIVPCGKCRNCRNIAALNFEGLLFAVPLPPLGRSNDAVDLTSELLEAQRAEPFRILAATAGTNIPKAAALAVKASLARKASEGTTRLALFHRMERMRTDSADALLKLIEEPPGDTVIVLTTERPDTLLPTIQSRAQKIRLERIPRHVVEKYLRENYDVGERKAGLAARLSDGSLGRAIATVDHGEDEDTSRRAVGFLLYKSMFLDDRPSVVAHLSEMMPARDRGQAQELLILWQSLLRDCARLAVTGDEDDIVNIDFAADLRRLSGRFADTALAAGMAHSIKKALADLLLNVHIPGLLASLVLTLMSDIEAAA